VFICVHLWFSSGMATDEPPEYGSLVIAALLLLALAFAGYWITTYVQPGADPWSLLPWFALAAGVIFAVALAGYLRPGRKRQ
jgi:hypothetical protein